MHSLYNIKECIVYKGYKINNESKQKHPIIIGVGENGEKLGPHTLLMGTVKWKTVRLILRMLNTD